MIDYKHKGIFTDIQVHLTNYCNHNCIHCYTKSNTRNRIVLSNEVYKNILDFANNIKYCSIRILGGEIINESLGIRNAKATVLLMIPTIMLITN